MINYLLNEINRNNHIVIVRNNGMETFDDDLYSYKNHLNEHIFDIKPFSVEDSKEFMIYSTTNNKIQYVMSMLRFFQYDNEKIKELKNRFQKFISEKTGINITLEFPSIYNQFQCNFFNGYKSNLFDGYDIYTHDLYRYNDKEKNEICYFSMNEYETLEKIPSEAIDSSRFYEFDDFGNLPYSAFLNFHNFLKEENITYEDFILNTKYFVIIDGKNKYDKFKEKGMIQVDQIKKEYRLL